MVYFTDDYRTYLNELKSHSFEIGPIRPPSEGGSFSLLIRVTRNCPWNQCAFCYGSPYNHERFSLRLIDEVKADIDAVNILKDELKNLSWKLRQGGKLESIAPLIKSNVLYGKDFKDLPADELKNFQSIVNVFNWTYSGGKTVFLQDADTPVMHTDQLIEVIKYIQEKIPGIERITSYARSKTLIRKKPEELKQLREAGLSRLHVGLETGDDELLKYINKGVTSEEHILAGRKALEAGFELSEYVMPGLGGRSRWAEHAKNTARVLNEINPHFIRLRPFIPMANTPMFEAYKRGEYELTSPHERLMEIGLMVKNLEVTSRLCFDHRLNPCYQVNNRLVALFHQDYSGYKFPEEKDTVLELINRGLGIDEKAFVDARDMIGAAHL